MKSSGSEGSVLADVAIPFSSFLKSDLSGNSNWSVDEPISVPVELPLLVKADVAYRIKLISAQLIGTKSSFGTISMPSCYCTVSGWSGL